ARLRSRYHQWRAALERIAQVTTLPDPVFTFAQFVEEVQTRTGPQERRYGLSQTFPWFGKLDLRGRVASLEAEELWQGVQSTRLEVTRDIAVAYYEYGYLSQALRITRESLDLLQQLDPVVQRRIASGTAGQEDLLRLQVEVGKLSNELASFESVQASLSSRLASAMSWPEPEALPLPELREPGPSPLAADGQSVDALVDRATTLNPRLVRLRESIRKNERARELAGLARWPDATLGLDYFETGSALTPTLGSGDDPVALRLMFNLPIWGKKYAAAEREADQQIDANRFALLDASLVMRADLEYAAFQLADAARQVSLYRDSLLPRASESLNVTRASYRAGRATLLDVIDSERARLQFEIAYWRACRDQFQSHARLEAIVGGEVR
ncbi:MAG TPA: TolC family protein, partial [Planctomycetota bacterium]|nr:TolC family protein [Planctomycetota bacterium]